MTDAQLNELVAAAKEVLDQLRITNANLRKGMSRSIQRLQCRENQDAVQRLEKALLDADSDTI